MACDDAARAFESEAARYEDWYGTPAGMRADRAERALISSLLRYLGPVRSVLDIACGTGHFVPLLEAYASLVFGLDRSGSMLGATRSLGHQIPLVLADAQMLPLRSRSVSVSVMVTSLEFIPDPGLALSEAVRVSTDGLVVVALHRRSLGAIGRRLGRSPILSHARDFTARSLTELIDAAAGDRLRGLSCAKALPPAGRLSLPIGEVIGAAARLSPSACAGQQ